MSAPSEQKTILAVDDEPGIARLIKVNLERAGYAVDVAENGQEALGMIEADPTRYALVISDVMMPKKDGYELLSDIRRDPVTTNLPVILLTAKSQNEDITQGYSAGTDMYLTKPFSPPELLMWVDRVLKGVTDDSSPNAYKL
jgi:DNA-binding response OmpR family regulator